MFISINHIPVARGREQDFERMFKERERAVEDQPGFHSLDVLRPGQRMLMGGQMEASSNEYQVLTRWQDEEAFRNWIQSDAFKRAHSRPVDHSIFDGKSYLTLHEVIPGTSAAREGAAASSR